jgi:hypothetical protein
MMAHLGEVDAGHGPEGHREGDGRGLALGGVDENRSVVEGDELVLDLKPRHTRGGRGKEKGKRG